MPSFPKSSVEIKELALKLVKSLRSDTENTHGQKAWSRRNFRLLEKFSAAHHATSFPSINLTTKTRNRQFLWDFVGYVKERGILIAAESEWNRKRTEIELDFEKLLYVRSPLKLMMCRMKTEEEAEQICKSLGHFAKATCKEFSSGEVFIIYCVWWAENEGKNRDRATESQTDWEQMLPASPRLTAF
jgi:hypothetical protein